MAFGGLLSNGRFGNDSLRPHTRVALGGHISYNTRVVYCVTGRENGSCLLHLLRVASFAAILVAALCSRISSVGGARRFTCIGEAYSYTWHCGTCCSRTDEGSFLFQGRHVCTHSRRHTVRNACRYPLSSLHSNFSSLMNAQRSHQQSASVIKSGKEYRTPAKHGQHNCATASRLPAHCGAVLPPIQCQLLTSWNDQCVGYMTRS
jgi:hypothetical protein